MSLPEELYNTVFFPICLPFFTVIWSSNNRRFCRINSAAAALVTLWYSAESTSLFPFPLLLKAFPSPPKLIESLLVSD